MNGLRQRWARSASSSSNMPAWRCRTKSNFMLRAAKKQSSLRVPSSANRLPQISTVIQARYRSWRPRPDASDWAPNRDSSPIHLFLEVLDLNQRPKDHESSGPRGQVARGRGLSPAVCARLRTGRRNSGGPGRPCARPCVHCWRARSAGCPHKARRGSTPPPAC